MLRYFQCQSRLYLKPKKIFLESKCTKSWRLHLRCIGDIFALKLYFFLWLCVLILNLCCPPSSFFIDSGLFFAFQASILLTEFCWYNRYTNMTRVLCFGAKNNYFPAAFPSNLVLGTRFDRFCLDPVSFLTWSICALQAMEHDQVKILLTLSDSQSQTLRQ